MDTAKPKSFEISKQSVWQAYQQVKANRGGCGVDQVSLEAFEENLQDNLYKIWNRLSSGSYMPPPVRRVDIEKADGGTRPLGIPTVGDRIAQMVVKRELDPKLEPIFHAWSYGYRPGRSALDAVGAARKHCWQRPWVLDLDIKGFFDSIDHELLLKAVRQHTDSRWHVLYIERWLRAPVLHPDGRLEQRTRGTPQGGVISPLLANLFLHYAFDVWMQRHWPDVWFERYADDMVCHCETDQQAQRLWESLRERFAACRLTLHPTKTQIVYCKDERRKGTYPNTRFEFLGFEFRGRMTVDRRGFRFIGFNPAISPGKVQRIRNRLRQMVGSQQCGWSLSRLARRLNSYIRGWWNYYGQFFRSELEQRVGRFLDARIVHWARRKYKRLKNSCRKTWIWLRRVKRRQSGLFAHWSRGWMGRAV
jgi:group II intron reverse transcriptase/maturase